jgi:phage-related tail protein
MVGERGPEMVNLPAGSQIIPHNQLSSSVSLSSAVGGAGNDRPIVVQVMLDRKVLAQGVARAKSDIAARK